MTLAGVGSETLLGGGWRRAQSVDLVNECWALPDVAAVGAALGCAGGYGSG